MKNYCLGFVFSPDQDKVLLIQKRSTDKYNPNCWNGLGGKVEKNETPLEAMVRETKEEASLRVDPEYWSEMGVISDDETYTVHVFSSMALLDAASTSTDEEVREFDRSQVKNLSKAANIENILSAWMSGKTV